MLAEPMDGEDRGMAPELQYFIAFWVFAVVFAVGLYCWNYVRHGDDDDVGPMPF